MIRQYLPMAPTLVRAPFHRVGWIYEEKVDGYRMLAYKEDAHVRLVSRNGVDHTRRYPDVAAAVAQLRPSTLVLDGELAVFDEQLRSRFEWLRDPDPTAVATPPVLIAFDVLYVKGRDVSQRPLRERRARLEDLLAAADAVYSVRRLAADGLEAWAQVVERGYEGLVAKDEASAYEGGRTIRWLKVKQKGWTVEEDRLAAEDQRGTVARAEGEENDTTPGSASTAVCARCCAFRDRHPKAGQLWMGQNGHWDRRLKHWCCTALQRGRASPLVTTGLHGCSPQHPPPWARAVLAMVPSRPNINFLVTGLDCR